jgi:hypothetical protein
MGGLFMKSDMSTAGEQPTLVLMTKWWSLEIVKWSTSKIKIKSVCINDSNHSNEF